MNALIKFNRGMLGMPLHWQPWLMLMVATNIVAPFFFLSHVEAVVVLLTTLAGVGLMTVLVARFGFTRILGLGHILWVPMLAYLFTRLGHIPAGDPFGLWVRTVLVVDAISLVIDAVDVVRYVRGDRQETVAGL